MSKGDLPSVKVGTRKSQLAMIQTNHVIDRLKSHHGEDAFNFEVVSMETIGDKILDKSLAKIGEKNLFTKELETALHVGEIDMIVHSLKDLPTTLAPDFEIGAILPRESPFDAVVMRKDHQEAGLTRLEELPANSRVGTSSLRRVAQLTRKYPHLVLESIRGNLNTRFRKLDEEKQFDAIILAEAGVVRMGWADRVSSILADPSTCLYAVGQGALAVETRVGDSRTLDLLRPLCHEETVLRCLAERCFLKKLEGGCSTPVGVFSSFSPSNLTITGRVLSLDGTEEVSSSKCIDFTEDESGGYSGEAIDLACLNGDIADSPRMKLSAQLGFDLALSVLDKGAGRLLKESKATIAQQIAESPQSKPPSLSLNGHSNGGSLEVSA